MGSLQNVPKDSLNGRGSFCPKFPSKEWAVITHCLVRIHGILERTKGPIKISRTWLFKQPSKAHSCWCNIPDFLKPRTWVEPKGCRRPLEWRQGGCRYKWVAADRGVDTHSINFWQVGGWARHPPRQAAPMCKCSCQWAAGGLSRIHSF